ncbi:MAG TPA: response regulator [Dissulfurispiraceae bacterium]
MPERKTVLIIENDAIIRELLEDFLGLNGFAACGVSSGVEAIRLVHEKRFDIIITDYSMPVMNGAEFVRAIRPRNPRTFIIGISGVCGPGEFLSAGANAFVRKPFQLKDLLEIFEAL